MWCHQTKVINICTLHATSRHTLRNCDYPYLRYYAEWAICFSRSVCDIITFNRKHLTALTISLLLLFSKWLPSNPIQFAWNAFYFWLNKCFSNPFSTEIFHPLNVKYHLIWIYQNAVHNNYNGETYDHDCFILLSGSTSYMLP